MAVDRLDFICFYSYLLYSKMILCLFKAFSSDITTLIFMVDRCEVK